MIVAIRFVAVDKTQLARRGPLLEWECESTGEERLLPIDGPHLPRYIITEVAALESFWAER